MPDQDGAGARLAAEAGELRLRVHAEPGGRRLELRGELDVATVDSLEGALDEAIAADSTRITLDLRELTFIDSSGLRTIFSAHGRAAGRLVVVRGPRTVQRAFELCGLQRLLAFVDEPAGSREGDRPAPRPDGGPPVSRPVEPPAVRPAAPEAPARPTEAAESGGGGAGQMRASWHNLPSEAPCRTRTPPGPTSTSGGCAA